jgi:hypothetical protein
MIIKPTQGLKEAPLILRNHPGYREVMECLRASCAAAENLAINAVEHVDLHRGRAQALRAVIQYLEGK